MLLWQWKIFLNNADGPSNQHAEFEIFMDLKKVLEIRDFPIGLYCGWHISANCHINLWENHLLLGLL